MARLPQRPLSLSPGQAKYVLERLIAERRVAPGEVSKYVSDMGNEIAAIERRLVELRAAAESGGAAVGQRSSVGRSTERRSKVGKRPKRRGNPLAGSYMGYMRQVRGSRKKAEFKAVRNEHGYERAIAALRKFLGK